MNAQPPSSRYQLDRHIVPTPTALRRYFRDDTHFTLLLRAVTNGLGNEDRDSYRGERRIRAQHLLRLLSDSRPRPDGRASGLNDPEAHKLLLALFPPSPCAGCGKPICLEPGRRAYCSVTCQQSHHRRAS